MMELQDELDLSEQEIADAIAADSLKILDETGIFTGARFSLWTSVGGEMQLVSVRCKGGPYWHRDKRGRKWRCVDVFGYGVRKRVSIKKLRETGRE